MKKQNKKIKLIKILLNNQKTLNRLMIYKFKLKNQKWKINSK